MSKSDKEFKEFGEDLAQFLLPVLNDKNGLDPLMIAGIMMRMTIEIYTKVLDDNAIHSLLEVVASSVNKVRSHNTIVSKTIH